ncbi:MAG: hypothetical protein ACYC4K_08300 [Thiobacillus sp.]
MYADPTRIRAHELKIRLNDSEAKLLDALVEYTGDQRAVIAREMLLAHVRQMLKTDLTAAQN